MFVFYKNEQKNNVFQWYWTMCFDKNTYFLVQITGRSHVITLKNKKNKNGTKYKLTPKLDLETPSEVFEVKSWWINNKLVGTQFNHTPTVSVFKQTPQTLRE